MKILMNARMRIRYAYEGLVVLEYRVKGLFWGYNWKQVAYTLASPLEDSRTTLKRLQSIRQRKLSVKRKAIKDIAMGYLNKKDDDSTLDTIPA